MAQDTKAKDVRPYVPWRTFFNLLERMAEEPPPPRIDRTYIKNLDGTAQAQLMAALRWIDGISDDGTIQDTLRDLIGSDRKKALADLVRAKYPEAVALAGQNATQGQLDEVFRAYGLNGDTMRRAQSFFLNAAEYAGVPLSRHFKKPRSAASTGTKPAGEAAPARKRATGSGTGRKGKAGAGARGGGGTGGQQTGQQVQSQTVQGDARFITLSDGKTTLSLNLSAGVFSLPIADRKWVLSVLEMLDNYEMSRTTEADPIMETPTGGDE
ncbi:MAG: hypothetical protein DWI58_15580 [Chloroflexi bacterium]|nr:MAG: hypothetical protein DWI58_15580 [Chloroflexota bacterium]